MPLHAFRPASPRLPPGGTPPSNGYSLRLVLRQIDSAYTNRQHRCRATVAYFYRSVSAPPLRRTKRQWCSVSSCSTTSSTPVCPCPTRLMCATIHRIYYRYSANCVPAGMTRLWSVCSTTAGVARLGALQRVHINSSSAAAATVMLPLAFSSLSMHPPWKTSLTTCTFVRTVGKPRVACNVTGFCPIHESKRAGEHRPMQHEY